MSEGKIGDEARALVERGGVTSEELAGHAFNSRDWEALVPALTDEALLGVVEHAMRNSRPKVRQDLPCLTYDETMVHLYGPELVRRLRERGAEPAGIRSGPSWLPELAKALGRQDPGGRPGWTDALRRVEELRAEVELLRAALSVDRTGLAVALQKVVEAAKARAWIAMGESGCHEASEDAEEWLRGEIGDALDEVREIATDALRFSGDLVAVLLGSGPLFECAPAAPTASGLSGSNVGEQRVQAFLDAPPARFAGNFVDGDRGTVSSVSVAPYGGVFVAPRTGTFRTPSGQELVVEAGERVVIEFDVLAKVSR